MSQLSHDARVLKAIAAEIEVCTGLAIIPGAIDLSHLLAYCIATLPADKVLCNTYVSHAVVAYDLQPIRRAIAPATVF